MVNNMNMLVKWVLAIASVLGGVAIGGLFTTGATLGYPVLEMITSQGFHTTIGWIIIVGGIVEALKIFKLVK